MERDCGHYVSDFADIKLSEDCNALTEALLEVQLAPHGIERRGLDILAEAEM